MQTASPELSPGATVPHVIVITGPTASGKSALAVRVAQYLNADIISADSRQIFRGIPVSTAVPTLAERGGVTHHLLEHIGLDEYYSAANFADDATRIIREAAGRGQRYVVVCGGSMMYIDALLGGLDDLPFISDEVRARVVSMKDSLGMEGLLALLSNLDAATYERVDRNNPRRVMHAVELCIQTGRPASALLGSKSPSPLPFTYSKFALSMPRDMLFQRINRRVDAMVEAGMEAEARSVFHLRHLNSLNTIGFKEWFAHFDGLMDRETTIGRIAKNTRVYAKKQLTWLSRNDNVTYLEPASAFERIIGNLTQG